MLEIAVERWSSPDSSLFVSQRFHWADRSGSPGWKSTGSNGDERNESGRGSDGGRFFLQGGYRLGTAGL